MVRSPLVHCRVASCATSTAPAPGSGCVTGEGRIAVSPAFSSTPTYATRISEPNRRGGPAPGSPSGPAQRWFAVAISYPSYPWLNGALRRRRIK